MRSLIPVLTLLFLTSASVSAQSASDLFQQAVVMERTQGDLLGAIALYQRVVDSSSDRSLTADALVRIGQNYERLGRDGALDAYRRVISDFGDLTEPANLAQQRISALQQPTPTQTRPRSYTIPFRTAGNWENTGMYGADVSSSGRYIVREGSGGEHTDPALLSIDDLLTGETRDLTTSELGCEWPVTMQMSPDETRLAYGCADNPDGLVMHNLETGENTVLVERPHPFPDDGRPGYNLEIYDWTSDGEYVLASFRRWRGSDQEIKVGLVPVDGGEIVIVDDNALTETRRWRELNGACTIHGSGYMLGEYVSPPSTVAGAGDPRIEIWLFGRDQENGIRVAGDGAFDYELFGCQDSGRFYYSRKREKNRSLYVSNIASDGTLGSPQFVQELPSDADPILTDNDRLFYTLDYTPDLVSLSADINPETGLIKDLRIHDPQPTAIRYLPSGHLAQTDWPSGTSYIESRSGERVEIEGSAGWMLWPAATAGDLLLVNSTDRNPDPVTLLIDPVTGEIVHRLTESYLWASPDGTKAYSSEDTCLREVHIPSGESQKIVCGGIVPGVEVSADGRWFAGKEVNQEEAWRRIHVLDRNAISEPRMVLEKRARNDRIQWSGGKLFIYGGSEFWSYDPVTDELTELSTFAEFAQRGFKIFSPPFTVSHDGTIVRVMGLVAREELDIEVLVIETDEGGR